MNYQTRLRYHHIAFCHATADMLSERPDDIDDETFVQGVSIGLNGGAPEMLISDAVDLNLASVRRWGEGKSLPLPFVRHVIFDKMAAGLRSYADRLRGEAEAAIA